jgi:hypothetical protein
VHAFLQSAECRGCWKLLNYSNKLTGNNRATEMVSDLLALASDIRHVCILIVEEDNIHCYNF